MILRQEPRQHFSVRRDGVTTEVTWFAPLEGRTTVLEIQPDMPTSIDPPYRTVNTTNGGYRRGPRDLRDYWLFGGDIYSSSDALEALDVKALLLERENRLKVRVARARALMEQAAVIDSPRRHAIPDDVKVLVWQRDKGRCVRCGSNQNLEYDHIIPFSMGGSDTARNLQLLCEPCNRAKGGNLV